jgi:hypothetical protein
MGVATIADKTVSAILKLIEIERWAYYDQQQSFY